MSVRQLWWSADLHRVLARYNDRWVSLAYSAYNPPQEVSDDVVRAAVPLIPATVWRTGDPPPTHRVVLLTDWDDSTVVWDPATWTMDDWVELLRANGPVVQIADYEDAVAHDDARRAQ